MMSAKKVITTLAPATPWFWPNLPLTPVPTEQEIRDYDRRQAQKKGHLSRDKARLRLNSCQISIALARRIHERLMAYAEKEAAEAGTTPIQTPCGLLAAQVKASVDDRMANRVLPSSEGNAERTMMKRKAMK